ncbi:MAG: PH domain-containing protein [Candidatus Thalassarchaeaceae archaeon]|jgi:hypothetical protein|nr:PH domain-containing protein [Candidatus Thalassarchaeaceae archaeon]
MSDEELKRNMGSTIEPASIGGTPEYTPAPTPTSPNENPKLREKLGLKEDEELLQIRRPSLFAFMPAYIVGVLILAIHLFFSWADAPDDAEWYESIFYFLVDASTWLNGFGFAFVMLFFTWLNRVINHPASGRWVTTYLLLVSLTPLILNLDTLLANLPFGWGTEDEFFPFEYNMTLAGIFYSAVFILITFWYQKSFLYAVTNERVIHHQSFIYERDGLTFLHEKMRAVMKRRSPIGAIFGYATVYGDIGNLSHVSTETVGGGVAVSAPTETTTKTGGILKWLGRAFFFITYQRTVKTERFTPDSSFYGIRNWEETYDLMLEMMDVNSAVTKAEEQLAVQKQMVELLSNSPSDELPDMDELLDLD